VVGIPVDVTSDEDFDNLLKACERELNGKVDILVRSANFYGPILGATALTPRFKKSGGRAINRAISVQLCRGRSKCTLSIISHVQRFQTSFE